jgi:uncharacterized protein (DUF1810 family)
MSRLDRFTQAQESPHDGYAAALHELQSGGKRGHWMWYVFPQLAGLGSSEASRYFGIRDEAEAAAYLRDPVLRSRYRDVTAAVVEQLRRGMPVAVLMNSEIDARKLISSLTLFSHAAGRLSGEDEERADDCRTIAALAEEALTAAIEQGYARCAFTLARLDRSSHAP